MLGARSGFAPLCLAPPLQAAREEGVRLLHQSEQQQSARVAGNQETKSSFEILLCCVGGVARNPHHFHLVPIRHAQEGEVGE